MSHTSLPARFVSRRLLCTFGLLTLGSLLLAGCGGSDNNSTPGLSNTPSTSGNGPVTSTPRSFNNLEFTLSAPKSTFSQGEAIPLTLTVKNNGTQDAILSYPTSGQAKFTATQNSQQVWFDPQGTLGALSSLTISVGQSQTFTASWDQKNLSNAQQVGAGTYRIDAWLPAGNLNNTAVSSQDAQTQLAANPISLTISQ